MEAREYLSNRVLIEASHFLESELSAVGFCFWFSDDGDVGDSDQRLSALLTIRFSSGREESSKRPWP